MAHEVTKEAALAPSLADATRVWLRIGVLSFGGPAAQISLMHKEVVEARGWLSEQQFLNALSFCMLLPGPEAMQLATYAGWRLHGTVGGLIAGGLFVLPGALAIMVLAAIYAFFGDVPLVDALFYGIQAAVLVIVVEALLKVSKKALSSPVHWAIAGVAFVGIFFLSVPYPVIVALAALVGWFGGHSPPPAIDRKPAGVAATKTVSTAVIWLGLWALPFALLAALGANDILREIGIFFSQLAIVTFGGAYAVLAYMAQDVVTQFGWLTAGEMIDALGLAETTPGPLILVTQFVGFLAGFREAGLATGIYAALVTLWVTFVPCFLWIFCGAPYVDWISEQPRLRNALRAITAAVVGVILNLSIWFALHVLFSDIERQQWGVITLWRPDFGSLEWGVVVLFALSAFLTFRLRWGIFRVLAISAASGCVLHLVA